MCSTNVNKSAQSNLGRGPRRGGLQPACRAVRAVASSMPWRSFMNMHVTAAILLRIGRRLRRTIVTYLLISHKPQRWSWNWIYCQKAHESSFPKIRLPDGNVVKFSHTNRKHFTVGDLMAFPIVKMEDKNPSKSPLPLGWRWPQSNTVRLGSTSSKAKGRFWLTQQCLGPPHAPPQTATPTVEALSHPYAVNSLLDTMARPIFAHKCTSFREPITKPHYLPYPWTRPTYDAKRHPDPIRRFSTMHWTDRRTYGQTDRPTDRQIVYGKVWWL